MFKRSYVGHKLGVILERLVNIYFIDVVGSVSSVTFNLTITRIKLYNVKIHAGVD